MKIGVFCSANNNIDAHYFALAEELGTWMGREGHTLVYGGCNIGLMETIGRSVHEAGGRTIGMIPTIVEKNGRVSDYVDVSVACEDLTDRKALMLAQSDIMVALPGGVGTLDEVFTVVASHSIGYHAKPMVLYNADGFWNSTIAMLDDLEEKGFMRGSWTELISVAGSLEELKELIG